MPMDEYDWIFDFVLQFLESEKFDAEVMNFLDEKCDVFEDTEENKFIYSDIHKEFCSHIEQLMETNLGELGITNEMFFESCEKARHSRDINSTVFERLIAMEDFQTFKKIMTKRNTELQLESIKSIKKITSSSAKLTKKQDDKNFEEKDMDDLEGELEDDLLDPELLRAMKDDDALDYETLAQMEEEEIQDMLFQSLLEMEFIHRQEELEHAELARALNLSLAAEEERLRILLFGETENPNVIGSEAEDQPKENYLKDIPFKDDDELKEVISQAAEAKSNEVRLITPIKSDNSQNIVEDSVSNTSIVRSTAKRSSKSTPISNNFNSLLPSDSLSDPKPMKIRSVAPLPSIKALPPIQSSSHQLGKQHPDSLKLTVELEEKRRQTEAALRRNVEQLAQQRKQEEELRNKIAGIDPDEAERRAQNMRDQRDLLIARKKAEREKKVQVEEERKAKMSEEHDALLSDAVDQIRANNRFNGQSNGNQAKDSNEPSAEDIAEMRRSSLRMALARRMKNDLIKSEEEKWNQAQDDQFSELDRKLQQVEQLREDNRKREYILNKQLERQQAQIAKNVRISAAALTKIANKNQIPNGHSEYDI